MKVTYLSTQAINHVTPLQLLELGEKVEAILISVAPYYKIYLGHKYYWKKHESRYRFENPEDKGDWWGYNNQAWAIENTIEMVLEVRL